MQCEEILEVIEKKFPVSYALDWDNVGLLAGSYTQEVDRVYVALDATDRVIADAAGQGADLLITHHPLIFTQIQKINDRDFVGRRVLRLIQSGMAYYAMHTNYDVAKMADLAGEKLKLACSEVLEVTTLDPEEKGIGVVADLSQPVTLREYCETVKEAFGLDCVRVFGDPDTQIRRAAVVPGSGKSEVEPALEKQADVLVTGDIGHHDGIDAVAQGLCIIDAGHYGVEHIFIADMAGYLRENLPQLTVYEAPDMPPFLTV